MSFVASLPRLILLGVSQVTEVSRLLLSKFEFFPTPVLENGLALFIGAFIFPAPLFVLFNFREEHLLRAVLTGHFQYVNELLKDVRALPDSEVAWALVRAALVPLSNAHFTEEFTAIVTLERVS